MTFVHYETIKRELKIKSISKFLYPRPPPFLFVCKNKQRFTRPIPLLVPSLVLFPPCPDETAHVGCLL
jgi:hypothetical protein